LNGAVGFNFFFINLKTQFKMANRIFKAIIIGQTSVNLTCGIRRNDYIQRLEIKQTDLTKEILEELLINRFSHFDSKTYGDYAEATIYIQPNEILDNNKDLKAVCEIVRSSNGNFTKCFDLTFDKQPYIFLDN
jgi:hypothetical protein